MTVRDEDLFSNPEDLRAYREFCETQQAVPDFQLDQPRLYAAGAWRADRFLCLTDISVLFRSAWYRSPPHHQYAFLGKAARGVVSCRGRLCGSNGVLMLVIDVNGNAAMTVGAYEPLASTSHDALCARAELAHAEQIETGVAPEALCCVKSGTLYVAAAEGEHCVAP